MSSHSNESVFVGDNLDEAEQKAAAQLTAGGSQGKRGTKLDTGGGVGGGIYERRRGGSHGGRFELYYVLFF